MRIVRSNSSGNFNRSRWAAAKPETYTRRRDGGKYKKRPREPSIGKIFRFCYFEVMLQRHGSAQSLPASKRARIAMRGLARAEDARRSLAQASLVSTRGGFGGSAFALPSARHLVEKRRASSGPAIYKLDILADRIQNRLKHAVEMIGILIRRVKKVVEHDVAAIGQ
jgi:hypothetical protein